jgi:hypothetical protein
MANALRNVSHNPHPMAFLPHLCCRLSLNIRAITHATAADTPVMSTKLTGMIHMSSSLDGEREKATWGVSVRLGRTDACGMTSGSREEQSGAEHEETTRMLLKALFC